MTTKYYAHSLEGRPVKEWQPLEAHLRNVSKLAADFARPFGGEQWAATLGLFHDLGKGTKQWQAYLRHANDIEDEFVRYHKGKVEHSIPAAKRLYDVRYEASKLLSYCIAGHHGGLPNWDDSSKSALSVRLEQEFPKIRMPIKAPDLPTHLPFTSEDMTRFGFQLQFFVRMLFSCLVDADYLDTETAMDPIRAGWRNQYTKLEGLREIFWQNFNILRDKATKSHVNKKREEILNDCLEAAKLSPGLFSLTVPTGGGKTGAIGSSSRDVGLLVLSVEVVTIVCVL